MDREEAIKDLEKLRAVADSWGDTDAIALDMAIEALKTQDATEELTQDLADRLNDAYSAGYNAAKREIALSGEYERAYQRGKADATKWIPVKWHYITDEEREQESYPKDWEVHIDCEMPKDEQSILVSTRHGYVERDVCYEDGEYSLDSGWDWIEDIIAWMPSPEPYKSESEE